MLQHVHQVPLHFGMGCYIPGSSCFSSFTLYNNPFYRWGNWGLQGKKTWLHEPGNMGSNLSLSLLPQAPSVEEEPWSHLPRRINQGKGIPNTFLYSNSLYSGCVMIKMHSIKWHEVEKENRIRGNIVENVDKEKAEHKDQENAHRWVSDLAMSFLAAKGKRDRANSYDSWYQKANQQFSLSGTL